MQADVFRLSTLLPLLVPAVLIQVGLMAWALVVLFRSDAPPKHLPRWGWVFIILFVNLAGPIVFLLFGKSDDA